MADEVRLRPESVMNFETGKWEAIDAAIPGNSFSGVSIDSTPVVAVGIDSESVLNVGGAEYRLIVSESVLARLAHLGAIEAAKRELDDTNRRVFASGHMTPHPSLQAALKKLHDLIRKGMKDSE